MAFKLVVRNKLRVPVKGELKDEDGNVVKFNFVLLCKRLNQSQIDESINAGNQTVLEFLHANVTGWEGVLDEDGAPMEFTDDNLASVLQEAGMHAVCFSAYLKEIGATAKN